ncbi:MAG: SPOR domain-containing protein, partial [Gammaproteobacteria bacterium]|nr:SPOR domain-containing protein [Gammaproteobacteria bacterium]
MRFSTPVSVKVRSGSDLRSIIITLPSVSGKEMKDPGTMIGDEKKASRGVVDAVLRTKNPDLGGRYVVNLGISATQQDLSTVKIPENLEKYIIYQVRIFKEQKTWYRMRLGFFSSFTQAKKISDTLLAQYPDAWTTSVTTDEKQQALKLAGSEQVVTVPDQEISYQPVASAEKIESEFNEAKSSLVDKKYSHAIALFTKILRYPAHKYTQQSLELLGLAREKNGQMAHARAEYEEYLRMYGDSEDAERVDQRLKGILTADTRRPVGDTKTSASARPASKKKWSTHGTLSQFFRHDTLQIEEEDTEPTTTSLLNDINVSSRRRDDRVNDRIQVSASYEYDILNDGEKSVSRVRELFYELNRGKSGVSMRMGRQNQSTGGVLGRFDGINAG